VKWNSTPWKARSRSSFIKLVDFEPAAQRQNLSSGEVLGEKAVRATPERQEKAARLRDEVKRLREMELDAPEDELVAQPTGVKREQSAGTPCPKK
jgi:hypothetical protein